MSNKAKIKEKLLSIGFRLGCYDSKIEKLSKEELHKVLDRVEFGNTDIGVTIGKGSYVVEVFHVDGEVDFKVISTTDYAKIYGRIFQKQ